MNKKYQDWLLELTGLPTAAGCEQRVIDWVHRWAKRRRGVTVKPDRHGNLLLKRRTPGATSGASGGGGSGGPIYFTAHMDHPAFVVTKIVGPREVEATFRGGVAPQFFPRARVLLHQDGQSPRRGTVRRLLPANNKQSDKQAVITFHRNLTGPVVGQVLTWDTGAARTHRKRLFAPACDDLAGVAAALSAFDALGARCKNDVRVLLTRAEEVGFIGAIGACGSGIIPKRARVVALECSKSFTHDSPIGGGPIVRVGDRTSTFDPGLTYRLCQIAGRIAATDKKFDWQRCLMPGGTCEATAYQAYGYTAACLCLPLGNYHNMDEAKRRIAPETISLADFHGLVRLLIAIGRSLDDTSTGPVLKDRLDQLFAHRRGLLA